MRIQPSAKGVTPFQRLLGHSSVLTEWVCLEEKFNAGHLEQELLKQVRLALAQKNGCAYCKAMGVPESGHEAERISLAVAFSEVFLSNKENVPIHAIEQLKLIFSTEEISELCAFIAFTTACHYIGGMLGLTPSDSEVHAGI